MAEVTLVAATEESGVIVLAPTGDLGAHESSALRAALRSALDRKPRRLVVDLAGVPYMSSAGVATLVEALRLSREGGVDMVLAGLHARVKAVFDIARLTALFRMTATVEDAKK